MAKNHRHHNDQNMESWIPSIIMLVIFWPVGLIMLAKKFRNLSNVEMSAQRSRPLSAVGWVLMVLGVLALIGGVGNSTIGAAVFLALGGMAMVSYSGRLKKAHHRFDKYLAVIGNRKVMRVRDIAAAIPVTEEQACQELEKMIDEGRFPQGAYLDMSTRALVINGSEIETAPDREIRMVFESEAAREQAKKPEAAPRVEPRPQAKPEPKPQPKPPADPYLEKLVEIRHMDELIENEEVSQKIRRIEEVTASVFDQVKQNPSKLDQIRTFMNYYLPTTLKLLNAYAQLEKQKVAGENVRISKERIEKMLSQLVFAFEQQLDQMFEADAQDISSDITVLERMMAKDGLSENPYTLPKCPPKVQQGAGGAQQAIAPWDSRASGSAAQAVQEDKT
jgi:hypothetical protein